MAQPQICKNTLPYPPNAGVQTYYIAPSPQVVNAIDQRKQPNVCHNCNNEYEDHELINRNGIENFCILICCPALMLLVCCTSGLCKVFKVCPYCRELTGIGESRGVNVCLCW